MWSGPRNLSTAMMRSFGSRRDCLAMDEPFYAAYLQATGLDHPMCQEIIADGEVDPQKVIDQCLQLPKPPHSLVYQKHMTHHMIEGFDISWIAEVTNVFLIREPRRVLASYAAKTESVSADDIGFRKQRELFEYLLNDQSKPPAVVDAADIRRAPEQMLKALCQAIDIPYSSEMLSWEAGPKPEDGIWAKHWYDAVWNSTGFASPEAEKQIDLPEALQAIEEEVLPDYQFMQKYRLVAS